MDTCGLWVSVDHSGSKWITVDHIGSQLITKDRINCTYSEDQDGKAAPLVALAGIRGMGESKQCVTDPLVTNKCGLCGSLMVPDTLKSDAKCQLQLLSNFFIL